MHKKTAKTLDMGRKIYKNTGKDPARMDTGCRKISRREKKPPEGGSGKGLRIALALSAALAQHQDAKGRQAVCAIRFLAFQVSPAALDSAGLLLL